MYDKNTDREFHRKVGPKNEKGERTEIVEVRAICRNQNAIAYNHLVMAEYSQRQCTVWEKGKYKATAKPEKKLKETGAQRITSPDEYFGC